MSLVFSGNVLVGTKIFFMVTKQNVIDYVFIALYKLTKHFVTVVITWWISNRVYYIY